jgi:hypothetical protein
MEYKVSDVKQPVQIHTCRNCKHTFSGKICNQCGEKIFNEGQLSTKSFVKQILDFFLHWESKVLKTIKLNTFRPGFITKENLNGIRVPYAKPVQLYLVMSVVFFIGVSKIGSTDYIPSLYDYKYNYISDYSLFKWAAPLDKKIDNSINNLIQNKQTELENYVVKTYQENDMTDSTGGTWIKSMEKKDSFYVSAKNSPMYFEKIARNIFLAKFKSNISTYGKTFIFAILPLVAGFFFLAFFKKIKYYGAALILSVHFMVYNMLFYLVTSAIYYLPRNWFHTEAGSYLMKPFWLIFYNQYTRPVSEFVFGNGFEFQHLLFWVPWFFVAFKRLFNAVWWKNILISWLCSRLFFFFIFGVLKKALIAFTVWSMH